MLSSEKCIKTTLIGICDCKWTTQYVIVETLIDI